MFKNKFIKVHKVKNKQYDKQVT